MKKVFVVLALLSLAGCASGHLTPVGSNAGGGAVVGGIIGGIFGGPIGLIAGAGAGGAIGAGIGYGQEKGVLPSPTHTN